MNGSGKRSKPKFLGFQHFQAVFSLEVVFIFDSAIFFYVGAVFYGPLQFGRYPYFSSCISNQAPISMSTSEKFYSSCLS